MQSLHSPGPSAMCQFGNQNYPFPLLDGSRQLRPSRQSLLKPWGINPTCLCTIRLWCSINQLLASSSQVFVWTEYVIAARQCVSLPNSCNSHTNRDQGIDRFQITHSSSGNCWIELLTSNSHCLLTPKNLLCWSQYYWEMVPEFKQQLDGHSRENSSSAEG